MLKIIRGSYILLYQSTPTGEDAVYYFKPGMTDLLIVRPEYKGDDLVLALIVSQLQAAVERHKKQGGGKEEVRESCLVRDLVESTSKPELTLEAPGLPRRWNFQPQEAFRVIQ